jgi:hypothetical protein
VKTYELKERNSPLIHIYDNFAMCSNGAETLRVELTDEQIVQLAAHVTDRAARILKSRLTEAGRKCACGSLSKASPISTTSPR